MTSRLEFLNQVSSELGDIAAAKGLNPDDKGVLFQYWCRELLGQWNNDLDVEPLDTPLSHDGGVDFLLEDPANKKWLLGQCQFAGKSGSFSKDKFERLLNLARSLCSVSDLKTLPASEVVKDHLLRLNDLMARQGYTADVFYMTTADASDAIHAQATQSSRNLAEHGVVIHLWDNKQLRGVVADVDSVDADTIDLVEIPLHAKKAEYFSVKSGDTPCYVLCTSGNWAADIYAKYQQKLLAWNIRHYLGKKTINKEIAESAISTPQDFLLLNNGLTAIARRIEVREDGKHKILLCEKFQIINGGQTLGALYDARRRGNLDGVQLLMTVVETTDTNPTAPFNQSIIRARNTQNSVRLSDFRSNDPIQMWLERNLPQAAQSGIGASKRGCIEKCRKLLYMPKRRRSGERNRHKIQLEELAKIRHAFIADPWSAVLDARLLWTKNDDDREGKYEVAFGQPANTGEGYVLDRTWKNHALLQTIYAIVAFSFVEESVGTKLKSLRDKQREGAELTASEVAFMSFFPRGAYHVLSLMSLKHRSDTTAEIQRALRDSATLEGQLAKDFAWAVAMFAAGYEPTLDSMRPLQALRSTEVWGRTAKLATATQ